MIGIIGAMESEVRLLVERLEEQKEQKLGSFTFYTGKMEKQPVAVVQCGIGKCAAAICTQLLIDRFGADTVINTGIAGGIRDGLSVGDLVIGTEAVQHDFDVTALGYVKGYMCTGEDGQKPTVYAADASLCAFAQKAAALRLGEEHVFLGRIVSGDSFIASLAKKLELRESFQAYAAELEGAAVAQAAALNGVRFVILRVISDLAQENAGQLFEGFEEQTARMSSLITLDMLRLMGEDNNFIK